MWAYKERLILIYILDHAGTYHTRLISGLMNAYQNIGSQLISHMKYICSCLIWKSPKFEFGGMICKNIIRCLPHNSTRRHLLFLQMCSVAQVYFFCIQISGHAFDTGLLFICNNNWLASHEKGVTVINHDKHWYIMKKTWLYCGRYTRGPQLYRLRLCINFFLGLDMCVLRGIILIKSHKFHPFSAEIDLWKKNNCIFCHFFKLIWLITSVLVEDKDMCVLHKKYHRCWWFK